MADNRYNTLQSKLQLNNFKLLNVLTQFILNFRIICWSPRTNFKAQK